MSRLCFGLQVDTSTSLSCFIFVSRQGIEKQAESAHI